MLVVCCVPNHWLTCQKRRGGGKCKIGRNELVTVVKLVEREGERGRCELVRVGGIREVRGGGREGKEERGNREEWGFGLVRE